MKLQNLKQRSQKQPLPRKRTSIFLFLITTLVGYTAEVGYAQESPQEYQDFLIKFYTNELVEGSNTFNGYQEYFQQELENREPSNAKELYDITDLELAYLILLIDIDEKKAKDRLKRLVSLWEREERQLSKLKVSNISDYYRAYGEVLTRGISVAGGKLQILKRVKKAIKMFEKSIKEDNRNAKAYRSFGVLSSFTPKSIGGGSEVAEEKFNKSLEYATDDLTRFTDYIWLSQVYFKMKKTTEYQSMIKKAEGLYPNSFRLTSLKEKNEKNDTL